MWSSHRSARVVVVLVAIGCGGSSPDVNDGRDAAAGTARGDAAPAADTVDAAQSRVATLADMQGAWYAADPTADGGLDSYRTLRVDGTTYYEVSDHARSYCAETGEVAVAGGAVTFTPQRAVGLRDCTPRPARTAMGRWIDGAVLLTFSTGTVRFTRPRDVAKVFVTVETHHADFRNDPTLPGANAIEKADAFCNQSLARPDARTYKAVVVDGVHRAFPDKDWALRPDTTYYRTDGLVNVFRTGPDARPAYENNAVLPGEVNVYAWMGLFCTFSHGSTCNGWTSSAAGMNAHVGSTRDDGPFHCNVSVPCARPSVLVCVGEAEARDDGPAGTATASVEGAWYAREAVAESIPPAARRLRLRFEKDSYYLVTESEREYCVEVGAFTRSGDELHLRPRFTAGVGACREPPPRTEKATFIDGVMRLGGFMFAPIRGVPKTFITIETHNGDLASDRLLPGATAGEKADHVCNTSIARPDGGRYRAVLIDGVKRGPAPDLDWVLKAQTTYFDATGAVNVFTTDPARMPYDRHAPLVTMPGVMYAWTGDGALDCKDWTSTEGETNARLVETTLANAPALGGRTGLCWMFLPFVCVGEGMTPAELAPAVPDMGPPAADLAGAWHADATIPAARNGRTLRFDQGRYFLVWGERGYCAETGRFDVGAAGVRFLPERLEGIGECRMGDVRVEALRVLGPGELTLTSAGRSITYRRSPSVPKLFVTAESHDGNLAGDGALLGSGVNEKADSFCSTSLARPDGQPYRALIVDGKTRTATPPVDWVLRPETAYHHTDGNTPAFATDARAIPVRDRASIPPPLTQMGGFSGSLWLGTGLDGSPVRANCMGWSTGAETSLGTSTNWRGETSYDTQCNVWGRLVCVSQ